MAITGWRHYADPGVAPLCRSWNGSIWAIINTDYRQKIVVLENRVTDLENALKLFNAGDGVSGAEPVAANTHISRAPTSQTPQDEALPVQDEETIDDRARSLRRIAHDMTLRSVNQHGSKH